jgi:putative holliday junction resolvase
MNNEQEELSTNVDDIFAKHNIKLSPILCQIGQFNIDTVKLFLSFDYGTKRIGVASGNSLTRNANTLSIIHYTSRLERFKELEKIIHEWQPNFIVVGLPMHADGAAHVLTRASCNFGLDLHRYFNLPIIWIDERYTTAAYAKAYKEYVDDKSAALILNNFFEYINDVDFMAYYIIS